MMYLSQHKNIMSLGQQKTIDQRPRS